jgi:diaminopimelate decarboxylase
VTEQPIDWAAIAETHGTPAYVYDGERLLETARGLRAALHPGLEVFFSLKSNPNSTLFGLLRASGARAEVSSLAELRTVLTAGTPPRDVIFLGPGKSDEELVAAIDAGIYAIVCESFDEIDRVDLMSAERGVRQRVLVRVNPAYSVAGSRLTMGGKPRQFGIDEAAVLAAGDLTARYRHSDVAGVHVYLGTRILDPDVVVANTRYVLDLAERVAAATGIRLDAVDIGGGLGVGYFDGEQDLDLEVLAKGLNPLIEDFRAGHPGTRLILESGRFLTALCGTYLVRVRFTKESMGQSFAVTDGGTHHHMAAVGIGSFVKRNFPISLLGRAAEDDPAPWNVTGPLCTPNDTLVKQAALPALRRGDLLGVLRSGAYGPTASPVGFLSHGYPAEVLVLAGQTYLLRPRDTTEDILSRQIHHDLAPLVGEPRATTN